MKVLWMLTVVLSLTDLCLAKVPFKPDWKSLDSRPIPTWYDKAKIGVFVHWGVYSVPSYTSEWFWINWKGNPTPSQSQKEKIDRFMRQNYKPRFTYQDFAKDLTGEFFNATFLADMVERSGAKYVVFTSKHHEGFSMWPTDYSFSWNSLDVGLHRDVIGELKSAFSRKPNIHFGLYYSLYEWFNQLYLADKSNNFTTSRFVDNKIIPQLKELVIKYTPHLIWSDGEWEANSDYWKTKEFLAWLYNSSPIKEVVVVNDRWGQETLCKHGGFLTCKDRFDPGVLQQRKWENAMTIDKHTWGFNRASNIEDYISTQELIDILVRTVSTGGNFLMNIGPAKDGTISPIFQERLIDTGKWLKVNGEAIYGSTAWDTCQNDTITPNVWYTMKPGAPNLYLIMQRWPRSGTLQVSCPEISATSKATMLGLPNINLQMVTTEKKLLKIELPNKALIESDWAWVIRITNVQIL